MREHSRPPQSVKPPSQMGSGDVARTVSGVRGAYWTIATAGAVAIACAYLFYEGPVALGVFAGVLLGLANLWAISRIVYMLTSGDAPKPLFILFATFKMAALALVCFFLISRDLVDAIGLALGLGMLPLGLIVSQLSAARPDAATRARGRR